MQNIIDDNLFDLFMDGLKETIWHEMHLFEPTSLDKAFKMVKRNESKHMVTSRC
jgi:hypothetical protein